MKHFTVYNAQILFVASSNPIAWVVKRYKAQIKKRCIVRHPNKYEIIEKGFDNSN